MILANSFRHPSQPSRRVLAHRFSIAMKADFCIDALKETFATYGQPEIFNTDQGSQFSSLDFASALKARCVEISMDGRGSWRDNGFVERLWTSVKYEEVCLNACESVSQAKAEIERHLVPYNNRRSHTAAAKKTPDEFYFASLPAIHK